MIERLNEYDVVWNSPSKDASGSMPLGNGDIGLNVWVEEGEFLVLLGTFKSDVGMGFGIAAATAVVLGAAYMLWMVQRVYYGNLTTGGATISGLVGRAAFDATAQRPSDCAPDAAYCAGLVAGQTAGPPGLELFRAPDLVADFPAFVVHRVCCN